MIIYISSFHDPCRHILIITYETMPIWFSNSAVNSVDWETANNMKNLAENSRVEVIFNEEPEPIDQTPLSSTANLMTPRPISNPRSSFISVSSHSSSSSDNSSKHTRKSTSENDIINETGLPSSESSSSSSSKSIVMMSQSNKKRRRSNSVSSSSSIMMSSSKKRVRSVSESSQDRDTITIKKSVYESLLKRIKDLEEKAPAAKKMKVDQENEKLKKTNTKLKKTIKMLLDETLSS